MNNEMTESGNTMTGTAAESQGLFAQLVFQQANMAMMLLGRTAHPGSGEVNQDLDGARFFIDQLEMIENKTRGNLTASEQGYLKETLMSLRMAYVAAVESPEAGSSKKEAPPAATPSEPAAAGEEEHRKKFSKKY